MTNGEKLKLIRCALGMTQTELADRIGTTQQWVYKNEADKFASDKYRREVAAIAAENQDRIIQAIGALSAVLPTRKVS